MIPSRSTLVTSPLHKENCIPPAALIPPLRYLMAEDVCSFPGSPFQIHAPRRGSLTRWMSKRTLTPWKDASPLTPQIVTPLPQRGSKLRTSTFMHLAVPLSLALCKANPCAVLTILFASPPSSRSPLSSSSRWLLIQFTFLPLSQVSPLPWDFVLATRTS